jgi:hypothetical protein
MTLLLAAPASAAAPSLLVTTETSILNFDATTGVFLGAFASGGALFFPTDLVKGPDGNIYVSNLGNQPQFGVILRYDQTGAFLGVVGQPPRLHSYSLDFGPDGKLYVGASGGDVLRLDSPGVWSVFVPVPGSAGDLGGLRFHGGSLFITYLGGTSGVLNRYDGTTGAFITQIFFSFTANGPRKPFFDSQENLYVPDWQTPTVKKFAKTSLMFLGDLVSDPGLSARAVAQAPDGNLLVLSDPGSPSNVRRYNIVTGAPQGVLVATGSGGLGRGSALLNLAPPATRAVPSAGALATAALAVLLLAIATLALWRSRPRAAWLVS